MEAKKIIITGAATRIGAAIAKSMANYDVKILLHYNKSVLEVKKLKIDLENLGAEIFLIKADLNKSVEVKKIIPYAYKVMRGIDCLINNASLFENDNIEKFNENGFDEHININLKSPSILSRDFFKYIKKNRGNIINIIDQRIFKLTPHFFSYSLSKTGLGTLTKVSAMKFAPNIRVNGIAPGPTLKNKRQSEKHFKKQWQATLLKKKVEIENISRTVQFLINNDNITGQIIPVDSGQSIAWLTPDIINVKE
jgi:NAD(P)-dependent dehydrogenase (short-subunit alcohol dehydrogenase family)